MAATRIRVRWFSQFRCHSGFVQRDTIEDFILYSCHIVYLNSESQSNSLHYHLQPTLVVVMLLSFLVYSSSQILIEAFL